MLPNFPDTKHLELSDRAAVNSFTKAFAPYSDFNFVSLWTWNTDNDTRISTLNGNLIIDLKYYIGDKRVITFLGPNKKIDTLDKLIEFIRSSPQYRIKLLPEDSIPSEQLPNKYNITHSSGDYDYIYLTSDWINMEGKDFVKKRNKYRRFLAEFADKYKFCSLDISNAKTLKQINNLFDKWKFEKESKAKNYDEQEFIALNRLLSARISENMIYFGIYIDSSLVAFSTVELIGEYSIIHFEKNDHKHIGITEFLKKSIAEQLNKLGVKYINTEQDLDIEALRKSKSSWAPHKHLKKYEIEHSHY